MTDRYLPRACAPWKRCTRCALEAPDVKGEPPTCPNESRCELARRLERPQLVLYPPSVLEREPLELLQPNQTRRHLHELEAGEPLDERPWEEFELGKVAA